MNQQFEAAWRLARFFTDRGIAYAIIGGFAVQRWGQPRFTRDVDVTILLPPGSEEATLREMVAAFPARVEDPVAFALEHRVLPLTVPGGSEADVSPGLPGYDEEAIGRGVAYDLGGGRTVRLCSAEDLIIHKALAGRAQDVFDIEGIVARQGKVLDLAYVRRWLAELGQVSDDPEVPARFERIWAAIGPAG